METSVSASVPPENVVPFPFPLPPKKIRFYFRSADFRFCFHIFILFSFFRGGGFTKRPKRIKNYNMAPDFYNFQPNKDCTQEIGSKLAADGLPRRAGAAPIPAGDETTWPDGGLRCR
jgi:hypothetical protein